MASDTSYGAPLTTRGISRIVKEALRRAGLDDARLTAHSMGHTAITLAVLGGVSLRQAQAMARHSDPKVTMAYYCNLERVRAGAERCTSFYESRRVCMKRYAHLELTGSYVSITTTDSKTAETIIAQVERFVGGQIEVTHKEFWYELKKLRNRDTAVHDWLIGWLCSNGWEPYAVWGEVIDGGETRNHTTPHYCFRKEID